MTAPVVLCIHGLGLKLSAQDELLEWTEALNRGLMDPSLLAASPPRMAYYSPQLHPEVRIVASTARPRMRRRTPPVDEPAVEAVDEPTRGTVEEAVVDWLVEQYAAFEREPLGIEAPATRTRRRRDPYQFPTEHVRSDAVYRTFVRDVLKYFGLDYRENVNTQLSEQLERAAGAPVFLLSHSLGTIVAYDVLLTSDFRVDTWVTLGSPLGYTPALQARLRGWLQRLRPQDIATLARLGTGTETLAASVSDAVQRASASISQFLGRSNRATRGGRRDVYELPTPDYPEGKVERWFNLYDPRDPVVVPPGVGQARLAPQYRSSGRQRVYDVVVDNPASHPHSGTGYLETQQVAWLLRDFLARHQVDRQATPVPSAQ